MHAKEKIVKVNFNVSHNIFSGCRQQQTNKRRKKSLENNHRHNRCKKHTPKMALARAIFNKFSLNRFSVAHNKVQVRPETNCFYSS